jgi:hypothetical protein
MNNPDWRNYEEQIVRLQLESGCDGIFFDNPTVHPEGCYCEHCMHRFARFIKSDENNLDALRRLASSRKADFLRFRGTIAADFLTDMRTRARQLKPQALITCNNSLNSPDAFFSQCRTYGYNIDALSRAEDFVLVEDMVTQPRVLPDGTAIEYGPVYEMLHAIAHDKPVVACVLAEGDYHTPPNLMRLAMAEAAAHGASYLSWPTWPEAQRARMIAAVRPQADFLREHADLLNGTTLACDVAVFLPFDRWVESADCPILGIVSSLSRLQVPARVISEESLRSALASKDPADIPPALVVESADNLSDAQRGLIRQYESAGHRVYQVGKPDYGAFVAQINPQGPSTVRTIVRKKPGRTVVHLLNLNIARLSSFEDRVTPATDVRVRVRCRSQRPISVTAFSADSDVPRVPIPFAVHQEADGTVLECTLARLAISTILVIQ